MTATATREGPQRIGVVPARVRDAGRALACRLLDRDRSAVVAGRASVERAARRPGTYRHTWRRTGTARRTAGDAAWATTWPSST